MRCVPEPIKERDEDRQPGIIKYTVTEMVGAVVGLSGLYLDHRNHLSDLEINPLMVLAEGDGVRAVDVRPVWRSGAT